MPPSPHEEFSVRGSRPDELEEIIKTTGAAFKVPMPANSYRHFIAMKIQDPENIRILLRNEGKSKQIIGSNTIFRFQANFGPGKLDAAGLAWVGVHPDYQRKGLGLHLLEDCISYLEQAHCDVCWLYTSTMLFYHQRGWEVGFGVYKWILPIAKLTVLGEIKSKNVTFLHPFAPEDLPQIQKIYAEKNTPHPGTCVRDLNYWQRILDVHPYLFERLYCLKKGNILQGYVWFEEEGKGNVKQLNIEEYALHSSSSSLKHLDLEDALLFALEKFAREKSYTELGFNLPDTYPLVGRIKQLGARDQSSLFSGLMARIMDLRSFLAKWSAFYNEAVVSLVPETDLNQVKDATIVLSVEGYGILLYKNGVNLRTEIVRDFPEGIPQIPIDRSILAIVALGNVSPSNLVDSEMWVCPQQYLPLLDCAFPNIHLVIYQLDKF